MFEEGNSRRFSIVTLVLSLFLFVFLLGLVATVILFFKFGDSTVQRDVIYDNEVLLENRFHTYLWVDDLSLSTKKIESRKDINDFSLHSMEYGVSVYPLHIGSSNKEYICECGLSELEEFLHNEDFYNFRRGMTVSIATQNTNRRSTGVISGGLMLASAVSMLIFLYKTNIISLRIYAENEMEAERIATEQIKSRIIAEIDDSETETSMSHRYGNPYWDEMKDDCENCEKYKQKKFEKDMERKLEKKYEDRIRGLENKIEELTSCIETNNLSHEKRNEGPDDEMGGNNNNGNGNGKKNDKGNFISCGGSCVDPKTGDSLGQLDCLKFASWKSERGIFHLDDLGKEAIDAECRRSFNVGLSEDSFKCVKTNHLGISFFSYQPGYKKTDEINEDEVAELLVEFNDFCHVDLGLRSCYDCVQIQ